MPEKNTGKNINGQVGVPNSETTKENNVETAPPVPVQTDDDPRGHVGAQDEQVDRTLTPPAPEESVEKVSN